MKVKIKGIHYGLTLSYSYMLPLFDIEEAENGFLFRKARGFGGGIECYFDETSLETECAVPSHIDNNSIKDLLGIEKLQVFREICGIAGLDECASQHITLMYEPRDSRLIFYAIYLSRNTDYYVNTVRWVRSLLARGDTGGASFLEEELRENIDLIDSVFSLSAGPVDIAVSLLGIKGVGVKSAKALLLHGYGLTEHAPIDRHYARFLGLAASSISKSYCARARLNCAVCERDCIYNYSVRKLGIYNGAIQSLLYIYGRLRSRRSKLEELLVKRSAEYREGLKLLLGRLSDFISKR